MNDESGDKEKLKKSDVNLNFLRKGNEYSGFMEQAGPAPFPASCPAHCGEEEEEGIATCLIYL